MNYAEEKGVELLFLPPYSPNLNLIERLWKLVRSKCLRNRYFPTFEDFREALDMFFENINTTCEDELASMLSLNSQFFPTRNL